MIKPRKGRLVGKEVSPAAELVEDRRAYPWMGFRRVSILNLRDQKVMRVNVRK